MNTKKQLKHWRDYNKTEKRKQYLINYRKHIFTKDKRIRYKKGIFHRLCWSMNYWYKNGKIIPFDLWKIAKKQKLKCALSGEPLTNENVSVDHIIPKCMGGLNIPSNIRLTTKDVNMAKKAMTDSEFIEMCSKVMNHSLPRTLQ